MLTKPQAIRQPLMKSLTSQPSDIRNKRIIRRRRQKITQTECKQVALFNEGGKGSKDTYSSDSDDGPRSEYFYYKDQADYEIAMAKPGEDPKKSKWMMRQIYIETLNVFLSSFIYPILSYITQPPPPDSSGNQYCSTSSIYPLVIVILTELIFVVFRFLILYSTM